MTLSQRIAETRQRFDDERRRVLLLIDDHEFAVVRPEIVRWFQQTGTPIPVNDELLLVEVHKMRATVTGFDLIARSESIQWLRSRGVDV